MKIFLTAITLLLIMDPIGNIPLFLSILKGVQPERRRTILVREISFAYVVLLVFLFAGRYILQILNLREETIAIAGGIVLLIIALRMIFPTEGSLIGDTLEGEPFIVPLAIPLLAGPSTLAALLLLRSGPNSTLELFAGVTIAWIVCAIILLSSNLLFRLLKARGLIAMERLMGMILVMVAVQMFVAGLAKFLKG